MKPDCANDLFVAAISDLNLVNASILIKTTDTYLWHGDLALEPPAHPVVDTLRFPPVLLHRLVAVGLVAPITKKMNRGPSRNPKQRT